MQREALRALRGITEGKLRALHWINEKVQYVNEHSFLLRRGPKQAKHIKKHYILFLSVQFSSLALSQ